MRVARRAEQALLGAGLLRPAALTALRWIPPGAFARPAHPALWRLLHSLPAEQVTPMAVTAALADAEPGVRSVLSPSYLATLVAACPDPGRAPLYGGMTLEAAIHRGVERAGEGLRTTAQNVEIDLADQALADVAPAAQRLGAFGRAWQQAPETVRTLLEVDPEEPPTLAARSGPVRTDVQAEAETVASLMYRPAQLAEVRWLNADDFSDPQLRGAYRAMSALDARHAPVDPLTVAWQAARQPGPQPSHDLLDALDRGGMAGIAATTGEKVLATAALDRLDAAGHRMRTAARHPGLPPAALLDDAGRALAPVERDRERLHHAEHDHECEPADQEPAPPDPQPTDHARDEMEMDL
ncbi:DnaB-like helicase N-terminal domain-containing protein [Streptomyces synnematoformans]|uniref:DnaB-like helicase N-terminal domain-containing protein n=1 Tax=Streptomyces synnematoformans TaxID=415721 RepID=A0ABP5J4M0_9ACTN